MKIYFAGSIRGGRGDREIYGQIITILQNYGQVLTEHIADAKISSYGQTNMTDVEIYTKDVNWIKEADVVVAEVTNTSLGVGYELGFAESLGKKIIALYRKSEDKRLSAMIAGNKNINCVEYKEVSDLPEIFVNILK
jgi:nucleoside 2-deoxyribosyltransferase